MRLNRTATIPALAVSELVAVFVALALFQTEARAHHSTSIYAERIEIVIEGTIARYEWANPHVYLWVKEDSASGERVMWELEGQPPALLRRLGWTQDTVNVGDRVTITANPGRNPDRKIALMTSLAKPNDTVLNIGFSDALASLSRNDVVGTDRATNLAGTWSTLMNFEIFMRFTDPSALGLTEKGRSSVESFI